jgi:hypothetical protein
MSIRTFGRTFLVTGIFLLSVFVVSQPSWGCNDRDSWECEHYDRCDCHYQSKPCVPPRIQIVYLAFDENSIYFTIYGKNFDDGGTPAVTLGGIFDLKVESYSENQIDATLPLKGFEYGDYKLVVSTGRASKCKKKYCTDHGNRCDDKYWTGYGSKCKDKYCVDEGYKCEGKYCLTVRNPTEAKGPPGPQGPQGPEGPQGPPGVSNYEKTSATYTSLPKGTSLTEASCSGTKKLLGGGGGIIIPENGLSAYGYIPSMIYNGPNADGTAWDIIWYNQYESAVVIGVVVYAICADVSQ